MKTLQYVSKLSKQCRTARGGGMSLTDALDLTLTKPRMILFHQSKLLAGHICEISNPPQRLHRDAPIF